MYKVKIDNLNIKQIAESGQCFRWKMIGKDTCCIVAYDNTVCVTQRDNEFIFDCEKEQWDRIWRDYLDIDTDTDYLQLATLINTGKDEHLKKAYKHGSGIRILRQDLWEIIVTFIISQNNNIKRIANSVEMLCKRCGKLIDAENDIYSFPKPYETTDDVFDDKTMGFGYRSEYLREIYAYARNNPNWLDNLKKMSYDEAMESLLERKGIGNKVANCICLFGLHHVDAFPIDTHVKQLFEKYYADGFDFERYIGMAGIVQQYLFYYELQ